MKKILVIYLSTKYTKTLNLKKFIYNYTKYKAGANHKLLICFKGLDNNEIYLREKLLKKIDYIKFIDTHPINDYEFGSLKRILKNKQSLKYWRLHSRSSSILIEVNNKVGLPLNTIDMI